MRLPKSNLGMSVDYYILAQIYLECGPMPNLMVALPNTGGALSSTRKVWLTLTT